MRILEASRTEWTSRVLSVFRIVAGLIFVSYGTTKVFGFPRSPVPMPAFSPTSLLGIAGMLEIVGGIAIVAGLLTRPVAFLLSGEMAVAYFYRHLPVSVFPTVNLGVPAILYCFFFLYLSFAGAGAWSVDAMITRHKWLERHALERARLARERERERQELPKPARSVVRTRPELHRGPQLHRG